MCFRPFPTYAYTHRLDAHDERALMDREYAFGSNARYVPPGVTYCELIWEGLHDFTLIVLIVAAVVSTSLGVIEDPAGGWHEGVAILIAVVLVLNVGAFNDLQKDKKFRELNDENSRVMVKARGAKNKQKICSSMRARAAVCCCLLCVARTNDHIL